jgi:hypothetical protein
MVPPVEVEEEVEGILAEPSLCLPGLLLVRDTQRPHSRPTPTEIPLATTPDTAGTTATQLPFPPGTNERPHRRCERS